MKCKAMLVAISILTLGISLGFGATVRYHGNPRMIPDQGLLPGNVPGPGPFSFLDPPMFLDSTRSQFGIIYNRVWRISSNGSNVVGIASREYLSSQGYIKLYTSTDSGRTWWVDYFNRPPSLRSPHFDFTAPDRFGFITGSQVISTFDAPLYIRNSGGYGSGVWDDPVQIRPSGETYQDARGIWLGNSSKTICVPMEQGASPIPLMSEVIDTAGNIVSNLQTLFDRNGGSQDYRSGKVVCFGGGPTDGMNIKFSTDGGGGWIADSITIWAGSPDSGWFEYANVIRQDGSTGVLVTMDNVNHPYASQHSAIQFFIKGNPNKVTIFSPGPGQAAAFPTLARKPDNTLVVVFEYVPSGWDSVTWSIGRTFWDLGESHSTDGGLTWTPVRNLTNTPLVSECCPMIARFIGSNNWMHIVYGTSWRSSQPTDTADLYWAAMFGGGQVKTYNWYLKDLIPLGLEERGTQNSGIVACGLGPVSPNPMHGWGKITCQLSRSGWTNLSVYDALGRRVRTLLDCVQPAGRFTAFWDGRDESGQPVPAGLYFFRLSSEGFSSVRKVVVAR